MSGALEGLAEAAGADGEAQAGNALQRFSDKARLLSEQLLASPLAA
jgi:hypothetical protein